MTRTLVLTNQKGGMGKSTSATNIAFGLVHVLRSASKLNLRALLVNTGSQGHATLVTTGSKDYGTHDSLYTVLTADRKGAPRMLLAYSIAFSVFMGVGSVFDGTVWVNLFGRSIRARSAV